MIAKLALCALVMLTFFSANAQVEDTASYASFANLS